MTSAPEFLLLILLLMLAMAAAFSREIGLDALLAQGLAPMSGLGRAVDLFTLDADNGSPAPAGTPPATPPGTTPPGAGGGEGGGMFEGLFKGDPTPPAAPAPGTPPAKDPAPPAGTPPAVEKDQKGTPPAKEPPAWLKDVPEQYRNHPALQDKASPADVLKDYLDLKDSIGDYKPLQKPEDLKDLKLPEGYDPKLANQNGELDWFAKTAVELKLSPSQAQGVVNKFKEFQDREMAYENKVGHEAIKNLWGTSFEENTGHVNRALSMIGQRMGEGGMDELNRWVKGSPYVGSSPTFARFMLTLAKSVSEESLPAGPGGSSKGTELAPVEHMKEVTGWQS